MDTTEVGRRIRARREKLGWTTRKLATVTGLSSGYVSRIEGGKVGLPHETLTRIAGSLGISLSTLFKSSSNVEPAPLDYRLIPVLDYVQAGSWRSVDESMKEGWNVETIPINMDCPSSTFALRIKGDSMLPDFREGDIVVIDPTRQPKPGKYVVATDESGDATFKQYRGVGVNERGYTVFELRPLNPVYPILRSDRQQIGIVGVMIEHRRYDKD